MVKPLQILSHLLLVVAIFPLPHPSAIRIPRSLNRQNPHKSYLICFVVVAIQLFLSLHHFPVVSPVVSLRCVSPGRRLQLLTVQTVLSSEAVAASSSKRLPGETQCRDTTGAIAFPRLNRQISRNPVSSAFSGRYFSLASPMRHSTSQLNSPQILSHLLLVVAIFPLPHPCAIRFPKSNRQTPTSPISSAFSGRIFFSLAAPMCH